MQTLSKAGSFTSLSVDRGTFPLADCAGCGSRSLTWLDVSGETDVRRCLSCNAVAEPATKAGERTVEALGYVFMDKARKSPTAQKLSGCGAAGVKSCGTGGCSSGGGSCGSGGGGCGSGGCGS